MSKSDVRRSMLKSDQLREEYNALASENETPNAKLAARTANGMSPFVMFVMILAVLVSAGIVTFDKAVVSNLQSERLTATQALEQALMRAGAEKARADRHEATVQAQGKELRDLHRQVTELTAERNTARSERKFKIELNIECEHSVGRVSECSKRTARMVSEQVRKQLGELSITKVRVSEGDEPISIRCIAPSVAPSVLSGFGPVHGNPRE